MTETNIPIKGNNYATDPRLGRVRQDDPRNLLWRVQDHLDSTITRGKSHSINKKYKLNQGQQGSCVGHGWAHELASSPMVVPVTHDLAVDFYYGAQKNDDWDGGEYPGADPVYAGSSVLGGAKYIQQLGYIDNYLWAYTIDEIIQALVQAGPVVAGSNWFNDMFHPKPSGLIDITGSFAGGHCYLLRGVLLKPNLTGESIDEPVFRCTNSWGTDWGREGDFFIKVSDFETLLNSGGDVCIPLNRTKQPKISEDKN